ncbi:MULTISPECIES: hypothetical protein [Protofrankia]|uniref:Uncharacterized protein n=2 Tax=Protofrankia TaxID=2994361 RepID=F8AUS6_9ACTN|nr:MULTISPECIES: hypothetical protein [Protofrankia]AEH08120.1 hypothetical protein FsymDg_0590 [Candidatus Protofrankia datiscae]KLL11370.1 hypothetical protein FrCorBMG51_11400 [Protofrankia coriariae]ONH34366.1 hypothetical protein BL254_16870 [Protofrankia sp. BMG5.30]
MIISAHVGAGALIGTALRRPLPAFAAGFVSHLAMDMVPHWGAGPGRSWVPVARRDGVAGLVAMGILTAAAPPGRRLALLAGMSGACLPDTDKIGIYFVGRSPWPRRFDRFHGRIQRESTDLLPRDVLVAAALSTAAGGLLHLLSRSRPARP